MSLYADYVKEILQRFSIEYDYGFITYEFMDEDKIYICDGYVIPSLRSKGLATELADQVSVLGRAANKKYLVSSVNTLIRNSKISHAWHKKYGMKVFRIDRDFIYYIKEI